VNVLLPIPTVELVQEVGRQFDNDFLTRLADGALAELFDAFPANTDLSQVLLKVVALNSIYATNVSLYTADLKRIEKMAQHIFESGVDALIAKGDLSVVDVIAKANLSGKKASYYYSFASKYCAWQNHSSYAIYDSRARKLLLRYRRQDKTFQFNCDDAYCYYGYKKFYDVVTGFRAHYGLDSLNLRELDKFLYWFTPDESKQMAGSDS
jgi:hypothetical protein